MAERLYTSPFDKRSEAEIRRLGYPNVERQDRAIFARSTVRELVSGSPTPVFDCALRMAVGPGMQRRKLAVRYKLTGPHGQDFGEGRLKVKFGRVTT